MKNPYMNLQSKQHAPEENDKAGKRMPGATHANNHKEEHLVIVRTRDKKLTI